MSSSDHNSLVVLSEEIAGANCTYGGVGIRSGLDDNGDGLLQPEEVESTTYACNGVPGTNGTDGVNSLVDIATETAGSNCAAGGFKVQCGPDIDGSGLLDSGEVNSTNHICHGEDGKRSLVAVASESAGGNCPTGGYLIKNGLDTNGNGILDSAEVLASSYVCHGSSALMRTSNAPWGGVCQRGGLRIETGIDENTNGILDDSEVDYIQYVCNLFVSGISAGMNSTCVLLSDSTVKAVNWGMAQPPIVSCLLRSPV
ncbi:MAG: hypothetical protein JXR95_13870 [Deltaproteobacteria bacterium]|nr:hypothetical protein [Deltaproteobacteria bacterium]